MSLLLLFPSVGAVAVVIKPDADTEIVGSWTPSTGSDLYAMVDEAEASDSDYIISGTSPTNDICKLRLSDPAGVMGNPITVSVRYKKVGIGTLNLSARLLEGTTQIATQTWSDIGTDFTTGTFEADPADITDFTDLFVELKANVPA